MKCPYCDTSYYFDAEEWVDTHREGDEVERVDVSSCPECDGLIIMLNKYIEITKSDIRNKLELINSEVIYPKFPNIETLPKEVPEKYATEFREASEVIFISEKASAAISRRLLQTILRDEFKIDKYYLSEQIEEFINRADLPEILANEVDAIRAIGNFATHPIKNESTGEITEVEKGEAEWLLETLRNLLEFTFVRPAKREQRRKKLNHKLKEAGKPPVKKKKG